MLPLLVQLTMMSKDLVSLKFHVPTEAAVNRRHSHLYQNLGVRPRPG